MSTSEQLRALAELFEESATKNCMLKAARELDDLAATAVKDAKRLDWFQQEQMEIELRPIGTYPDVKYGFRVCTEDGYTEVYESVRQAIDVAIEETQPEC